MERDVFEWLQDEVKPRVDAHIEESLAPREYAERLWYPISTGGKRWRPGLVLLLGRICDAPEDDLMDAAAGVELLHNFTLVHDDVMDRDDYRRGEPAVWVEYGEASAINLGDMLCAHAIKTFPDVTRDAVLETIVGMCEGQQMDLDFEDRRDVTVEEYLEMVTRKTGALLDLCVEAPQLLSGTDFGMTGFSSLGPAFQIRDDLLDFERAKGRRQIGNDVRAGKRTLMVIHADDERIYDILDKPFDETDDDDVRCVRELLQEAGSMAFARETMREFAEEGLEALESLPKSDERAMLREFGAFLVERDV